MRKYNNYDLMPRIKAEGKVAVGFAEILKEINARQPRVVVMDCYPMVNKDVFVDAMKGEFDHIFVSDDVAYKNDELTDRMYKNLTDDRIFGVMTTDHLIDYFDEAKLECMQKKISSAVGKILVIGVGALLVAKGDINIHCSIARWECQQRFRKGEPNWNANNCDMDVLTKFKRGYFAEWRVADKHKVDNHKIFNYFVDANIVDTPKMMSADDYESALSRAVRAPFRLVPYFDSGVWGGQWMKDVCGLDKNAVNYAWCFDCVPEENSVLYSFDGVLVEMPAIDIVLHRGVELLGERVQARFGNEFPIRFDFLDTMGGGNLSLQVHPTTEYIQKNFNMKYTQDESYYILDCKDDACVYLGVTENIDENEFVSALNNAQKTGELNVEKYINKWKVKKHDHFLIPAGTVHCSGSNAMVLEISSTPYIFTFKLWDWGRLGLDGKPRAISIEHGKNVIDFNRNIAFVKNNLINKIEMVADCDRFVEEKTGLHENEFIETRRHWFIGETLHQPNGSVAVFNLVEGEEAEVVSVDNSFENFVVHYAETFVVPACVGDYMIRPTNKSFGTKLATIKAFIRG